MSVLTFRRRLACLVLLVGLISGPGRVLASEVYLTPDPLLIRAQEFEKERHWLDACRCYDELLHKERDRSEYRLGYQRCLRHYYLSRRQRDTAYHQALAKLTPGQALDVYEQVLSAVGVAYVDRPRVDIATLFQNGVHELELALDEKTFLQTYLPDAEAKPRALLSFRAALADWHTRKVTNRVEARDGVLSVARAAHDAGLTSKQSLLVPAFALEFACGCCNALDEYTLFVTPGSEPGQRSKPATSIRHDMLTDNLSTTPGGPPIFAGLITVSQFQESTPQEMREAVFDLIAHGAKGLILDVRGNPGGLFKAAVQVAEQFVGEGVIVYSEGQIKEYNHPFEARGGHVCQLPIIILVDGETASAAEVLAGALKELGRARLIGQQTYGKGSIQAVIPIDKPPLDKTPAAIRLTVARLLSPAKQPYSGRGVTPDVEVQPGDDALDAAKIHLRPLLNPMPMARPG